MFVNFSANFGQMEKAEKCRYVLGSIPHVFKTNAGNAVTYGGFPAFFTHLSPIYIDWLIRILYTYIYSCIFKTQHICPREEMNGNYAWLHCFCPVFSQ